MSRLRRRIMAQPGMTRAAAAEHHPWGTADTPMMMPMVMVKFGGDYAALEQMVPIWAPNGATIPATAPGRYDQVFVAGGGRY